MAGEIEQANVLTPNQPDYPTAGLFDDLTDAEFDAVLDQIYGAVEDWPARDNMADEEC